MIATWWTSSPIEGPLSDLVSLLRLPVPPFAEHESKPMTTSNDLLGLVADLSQAVSKQVISFWPRQTLCDKALGVISFFF